MPKVLKQGDSIPVDGVIVDGACSINEANITGESVPVYKKKDDKVFSSTINVAGYIKIKALKVGEDTSIATIIKMVEEASNSKAPISKLADKIAGIFVPIVMGIALQALSYGISGSNVKDFISGLLLGLSIAEMLVGVYVVENQCQEDNSQIVGLTTI